MTGAKYERYFSNIILSLIHETSQNKAGKARFFLQMLLQAVFFRHLYAAGQRPRLSFEPAELRDGGHYGYIERPDNDRR